MVEFLFIINNVFFYFDFEFNLFNNFFLWWLLVYLYIKNFNDKVVSGCSRFLSYFENIFFGVKVL